MIKDSPDFLDGITPVGFSDSDRETGTLLDTERAGDDDIDASSAFSLSDSSLSSSSSSPICHFSCHSFDPIKYGKGRCWYGSFGRNIMLKKIKWKTQLFKTKTI